MSVHWTPLTCGLTYLIQYHCKCLLPLVYFEYKSKCPVGEIENSLNEWSLNKTGPWEAHMRNSGYNFLCWFLTWIFSSLSHLLGKYWRCHWEKEQRQRSNSTNPHWVDEKWTNAASLFPRGSIAYPTAVPSVSDFSVCGFSLGNSPIHAKEDKVIMAALSLNLAPIIMMAYESIGLKSRFGVHRK